jgi:hypothetical protein
MRYIVRSIAASVLIAVVATATPAFALSTSRVEAVSFSDATTGYLVGGAAVSGGRVGVVARTTDAGATWKSKRISGLWLTGLTAVGGAPAAVSTYDDSVWVYSAGQWLRQTPILGSSGANFAGVANLAGGRRVVVGQREGGAGGDVVAIASSLGGPWTLDFAGPFYPPPTADSPPPSAMAELTAIDAAPGGSVAWAVGGEWTPSSGAAGSQATFKRALIYKTANGGSAWVTQTAEGLTGGRVINSVSAVSGTVAFAGVTGQARLLRTLDGSVWTAVAIPRDGTALVTFNAIDALDANTVVAVGDRGKIGWTNNASAAVPTWSFHTLASGSALRGVCVIDATHWVAVGDDETVVRTADGGITWTGLTSASLPVVSVATPSSGFVLGTAPVTISGTSSDSGLGVAAVDVRIIRSDGWSFNGVGWVPAETWMAAQTSDEWAHWSLPWTPDPAITSGIEAVKITARATDGAGFTRSKNVYSRKVSPVVGKPSVPTGLKSTKSFSVSGSLAPRHANGSSAIKLYFQKKSGGRYVAVSTLTKTAKVYDAAGGSRYLASVRIPKGSWRVRAYHSDWGHTAKYSGWRTFSVK